MQKKSGFRSFPRQVEHHARKFGVGPSFMVTPSLVPANQTSSFGRNGQYDVAVSFAVIEVMALNELASEASYPFLFTSVPNNDPVVFGADGQPPVWQESAECDPSVWLSFKLANEYFAVPNPKVPILCPKDKLLLPLPRR